MKHPAGGSCARPARLVRLACMTLTAGILAAGLGTAQPAGLLKVGMMPAVNSIPLLVAQHDGLFESHGVRVELVMFHNQLYRESGLQTHTIDGSISDLVNAIAAISNGFDVRVTSESEGDFALLTSPRSHIQSVAQWKGHKGKIATGSLEDSIVNYVSQRMLAKLSADPGKIDLVPVLSLPTRIQMLLSDKLQAACIPEPYATLARMRGAHLIADTRILPSTPGVLLFTERAITEKPGLIRAFYAAYDEAAQRVAEKPDAYRAIVVKEGDFPAAVTDSLVIPHFARARLPGAASVADVARWMKSQGMISDIPSYGRVTDGTMLN